MLAGMKLVFLICMLGLPFLQFDKEGDEGSIENTILHQFPLPHIKAANKCILLMHESQSPCALRYIKETLYYSKNCQIR